MRADPGKESAGIAGRREVGTVAAPLGGDAKHTEFPKDARGLPILDAAALEVLRAHRYFMQAGGDPPALIAMGLVIAWAILRGGR